MAEMVLWLLRPVDDEDEDDLFGYDTFQGFVIRARDAKQARALAVARCHDNEHKTTWGDPARTTCEPIRLDAESGIVMADYLGG